jgi:hypothetical protein
MSCVRYAWRRLAGDQIEITDVQVIDGDDRSVHCDNCRKPLPLNQPVRITNPPDCDCDILLHLDCPPVPHDHPPLTPEEQVLLDAIFGPGT